MEDLLNTTKQQTFDISKAKNITCKKCGGILFERAFVIKEVSGLEIGYGAGTIPYPIDIMVCKKCGEIYEDYAKELGLIEKDDKKESDNHSQIKLILD